MRTELLTKDTQKASPIFIKTINLLVSVQGYAKGKDF